jgi:hypothetical protein
MDNVPLTVAGVFLGMLVALWSIETLQQPDPRPHGPTETFADGSQWTEMAPSPRQPIASSAAIRLASW